MENFLQIEVKRELYSLINFKYDASSGKFLISDERCARIVRSNI